MTLNDIYRAAGTDGRADIRRFMRDMRRAGLRMRPYAGRNFWHGAAVATDNLQTVIRATLVPCQWDSLGRGSIVYPIQSLSGVHPSCSQ